LSAQIGARFLGVAVMVVGTMMVVVPSGGESRSSTYQQQQGGDDQLLHSLQRSMIPALVSATKDAGIKTATGGGQQPELGLIR
jgi:hypothetical protein